MDSKGDVTERLTAYLRELHLPTLRECFEEGLPNGRHGKSSSYQQYLLELVERECQTRVTEAAERMLRDSRLPLKRLGELRHGADSGEGFAAGADARGRLVRGPS